MNYVIVGNSTAAVGAVEAIRKNDKSGQIVIFGNENYHVYSRPLISYYLAGKVTEKNMKYRDDDFYQKNNVDLKLGKTVVKIDPVKKTVSTSDGQTQSYDKLLVATGSTPVVPPVNGLDTVQNVFTFTTFDDAKELRRKLRSCANVLILGAGLIGLKCAEGIHHLGAQITVVDLSSRVLSSILDDQSSEIVKYHLEEKGLRLILGRQVVEFNGNYATLDNKTVLQFDVLVIAVGVRANTGLLKEIGADVNRGIVIDERCQTSIPDIYAAGDCVESVDISTGERKPMQLLPNAYMQGECAGMNMSGVDYVFNKAIPMNSIGLLGLHIVTAGSYKGEAYQEYQGKTYKKLYYSDNSLNGYIMIGNIEKAGVYTSLIRNNVPLDRLDFELMKKRPTIAAFDQAERVKILGGAND